MVRSRSVLLAAVAVMAGGSVAFAAPSPAGATHVGLTLEFGTTGDDTVSGVGAAVNGDMYVAGSTDGQFGTTANAGAVDGFVLKFDANGVRRWSRMIGSSGEDVINDLAVTPGGDVYVVGTTDGLLSGPVGQGLTDVFVARYDHNGVRKWVRQFGTESDDSGLGIAVTAGGDAYVSGVTDGGFPGQTDLASTDGFVARYDRNGNRRWIRQFGTAGNDEFAGADVAVTPAGLVVVAGDTLGAYPNAVSAGGRDAAVVAFDSNGTPKWATQFGTSGNDDGSYGIAVSKAGDIYVAGSTNGQFSPNSAARAPAGGSVSSEPRGRTTPGRSPCPPPAASS